MAPKKVQSNQKKKKKTDGSLKAKTVTKRTSPVGAVVVLPETWEGEVREESSLKDLKEESSKRNLKEETPSEDESSDQELDNQSGVMEEAPNGEEESSERDMKEEVVNDSRVKEETPREEVQQPTTPSSRKVAQPASPWGGRSFSEIMKRGEMKTTPEDIRKATISARRELLQPKVQTTRTDPSWRAMQRRSQSNRPSLLPTEKKKMHAQMIIQQMAKTQTFARLKAEEANRIKEEKSLLLKAYDFLSTFKKRGEEMLNCSMCIGKAASLLKEGGTILKIDFRLLLNRTYKDLALKVVKDNDRKHTWLKPILVKFLVEQGMKETDACNVQFFFQKLTLKTVPEFMQTKENIAKDVRLLHGERTVYAATALGRAAFRAHVEAFFSKHDEGFTYGGMFSIEDLLILDEETVVILADPVTPSKTEENPFGLALPEDKCKDMTQVWNLLSPFYTRTKSDGLDELPLHFDNLGMELVHVKADEVTTEKFRELVRCCFAMVSCMARAIFRKGVYYVVKEFGTAADPRVEDVFLDPLNAYLQHWKADSKGSSVSAIRLVANHKDHLAKLSDNAFGCLGENRHLLVHGGEHCNLDDLDELELLASDQYEQLMHPILKALLYRSSPHGKFTSIISAYKAVAKNDQQDLPKGT